LGAGDVGGIDRDVGFDRQKSRAGLEGEELIGSFDSAFRKDAEDAILFQSAQGQTRGGQVATKAVNGDRFDFVEEPLEPGDGVILAGHHPDDQAPAGGLDEQRVQAGGVVADQDGRALGGEGAGGDGLDAMIVAAVEAVDGFEDAKRELAFGVRDRGGGHDLRSSPGAGERAMRNWGADDKVTS